LPEVLDSPSDPADLCAYDVIGANKPETTEQYLIRSKRNAETLLAQEGGSFDHESEVKAVFKDSHYFKNKNNEESVSLLRELNTLHQKRAKEPDSVRPIQADPMDPFSVLYENCVVKPELFQDVRPYMSWMNLLQMCLLWVPRLLLPGREMLRQGGGHPATRQVGTAARAISLTNTLTKRCAHIHWRKRP
jgi:hypothetical protein